MNQQNFDDIKVEYLAFLEHIFCASSLLGELIPALNKYLFKYCKSKHCDKNFAENLEINLLYLEMFYEYIDKIMEMIENVSLSKLKFPEIKNIKNFEDYLKIPENYEQDILVELSQLVDFTTNYKK